jgi:HAD superfamily hydrolase (TIGR01509 family)
MIETIIFDAEGVVVDTEDIWDMGQKEFLSRRGLSYDRDEIKPLLTGKSILEGSLVLKLKYGLNENIDGIAEERMRIVEDQFANKVKYIDGFLNFLNKIRKAYNFCIATSMPPNLLRIVDRRLGLSNLFAGQLYTLSDVNNVSKPDPALFLYAARQLRTHPSKCVVIEDAPYGIQAAKHAGMKSIGITTTYDKETLKKLKMADLIVDSFREIDLSQI